MGSIGKQQIDSLLGKPATEKRTGISRILVVVGGLPMPNLWDLFHQIIISEIGKFLLKSHNICIILSILKALLSKLPSSPSQILLQPSFFIHTCNVQCVYEVQKKKTKTKSKRSFLLLASSGSVKTNEQTNKQIYKLISK